MYAWGEKKKKKHNIHFQLRNQTTSCSRLECAQGQSFERVNQQVTGSAGLRELGRREEHSDASRCEGCTSVCLESFPLDVSAALMNEVSKDIHSFC